MVYIRWYFNTYHFFVHTTEYQSEMKGFLKTAKQEKITKITK